MLLKVIEKPDWKSCLGGLTWWLICYLGDALSPLNGLGEIIFLYFFPELFLFPKLEGDTPFSFSGEGELTI